VKGDYIAWLDSDDYYMPGKLTAQMEYMRAHPDCEIVFTNYNHFVVDKNILKNTYLCDLIEREKKYNTLCLVSSLAKSDIYKKCKFDKKHVEGEDNHILMNMKLFFGINLSHFLENKFYCRRVHSENTMNSGKTRKKIVRETIYDKLRTAIREKNNLISIIMPVKNGVNYIQEAIEGIKKQNMNMEIIVIDDGSTDNTAEIAKELGCVVIKNPKNLGQDTSKNIGLKCARGDYILFHDHDDVMRDNALVKMCKEFEQNKELQVVIAKLKDFVSPELKNKNVPIREEAYHGLLTGAVLFKREVFDTIGYFDEKITTGGVDILLRLKEHNIKTKKINIISTNRRIHDNNYGRTNKQKEHEDYAALLRGKLLKNRKMYD
jgi:glycosyltransferase involved in cell wall biosynthesis